MSFEEAEMENAPLSVNPYETLEVDEKATADQIKFAYRKKALKHHPDKASPDTKDEANKKFQEIAFAYAVLSDDRRRRRYDMTGSTEEVLGLEDDDFDWVDFYRDQFSSMVDSTAIEKIKKEYQGSEEETNDLLAAFEQHKGDLDRVYESIMLSNVIDDDDRFRAVIDQAISDGKVKNWKKYSEEPEKKRQQRLKRAAKEAEEADRLAEELEEAAGDKSKKRGSKKRTTGPGLDDLAALIQQRQSARAQNFFDKLEEKYAQPSIAAAKRKKRPIVADEPPEEAFEATGGRKASRKKAKC